MVQDVASGYVPPHNVLISAPHGNGKTVLLHWTANQARERGVNVVMASASELRSAAALMRATLGNTAAESAQVRTGRTLGAKAGLTANLAHESTVATPPMGAYEWRLALTEAYRQKPLLLVVDEGHLLPAEVANLLFNASQSVRGEGAPLLLVVAGTPDLEDALAKADVSFGDRLGADGDLRPGLLDGAAAGAAVSVPLREQGIAVDKDALDAIVENAQGYPYFLQLWGQVAYEQLAEGSERMTLAQVQQAFPTVQETSFAILRPTAARNSTGGHDGHLRPLRPRHGAKWAIRRPSATEGLGRDAQHSGRSASKGCASRHAGLRRRARRHAPHQALGLCRAQHRPGPLAARHPQPDGRMCNNAPKMQECCHPQPSARG